MLTQLHLEAIYKFPAFPILVCRMERAGKFLCATGRVGVDFGEGRGIGIAHEVLAHVIADLVIQDSVKFLVQQPSIQMFGNGIRFCCFWHPSPAASWISFL